MPTNKFKNVNNKVDFVQLEHEMLEKWENNSTFDRLREKKQRRKTMVISGWTHYS